MSQLVSRYQLSALVMLLVCLSGPGSTPAQAQSSLKDRIAEAQTLIRQGTREVLDEELMLTDEEQQRFWPLYDEYDADRLALGDRYVDLVGAFMERYESGVLSNDDADMLLDAWFDIEMDTLQIRQRYLRRFRAILPGIKVARFYQLESKIRAEVDAALALAIPLADPR